ncbi:hypothetical protein IM774_04780 [Erysipelotrichaceae bacterium RD49]|nr:hypothetical protein [Erysipelotrichaceae bacterium RD49]
MIAVHRPKEKKFSLGQFVTHYSKMTWLFFAAFLIFDLVLNILWMKLVPMGKAPDESVRIILSDYVFFNGHLPNAWEPAVRIKDWGFSYALRPMLVNILGAFNIWVVSWFTDDPYALLLSVRIISVFSKTAMLYFLFRTCEWLGWKPRWGWCAVLICSLVPQLTFLAGYHNNDTFCMCCVTAVLYCWIRGMKEDWTWKDCVKFAFAMGFTVLSYYNAYPYILFSIPMFFMTAFHRNMSKEKKIEVWKKTGVIVLITFLIAGWWFIRNMILYDGDVLGSKTRLVMGEMYAIQDMKPSVIFKPIREGISYWDTMFYNNHAPFDWATKTFMSSFALLGMMDFLMPAELYQFFYILVAVGGSLFLVQFVVWIIRALWSAFKKHTPDHEANQDLLFFSFAAICGVMVIMLSLYYSWTDDFQPQGRYIMPAFTSAILIVTAGYRFALKHLSKLFLKYQKYAYAILSWAAIAYLTYCLGSIQVYSYERVKPVYEEMPRFTRSYLIQRQKYYPTAEVSDLLKNMPKEEQEKESSQDRSESAANSEASSQQTLPDEQRLQPPMAEQPVESRTDQPIGVDPAAQPEIPLQPAAPDVQAPDPAPDQNSSQSSVQPNVDSTFDELDSGEQSFEAALILGQ